MGRYAGKQKRAHLQQSAMSVGSSNSSSQPQQQQQQQHLSRDSSIRSPMIDSSCGAMMPRHAPDDYEQLRRSGGGGRPQPTPLIRASPSITSTSASTSAAAKRNPYRRITKAVPPVPTPPGGGGFGGAQQPPPAHPRRQNQNQDQKQQQYQQQQHSHHPPPLPQNYFNPHQPRSTSPTSLQSGSDSYGMISGTTGTNTTHTTNTCSSESQASVDSLLRNDRSGGSNSDHLAMVMRHSGSSRDIADYFASDDGSSSASGCVTASTATVSTMQRKLLSSLSQSRMMMCANRRTNERTMSAAASILSAFSSGPEDDSDDSEDDGSSTVPSKADRSLQTAGTGSSGEDGGSRDENSLYRSRAATAENKAVGAAEASVAFETATGRGAALAAREQEAQYRRRLEREAARERDRRERGEETDHFDEETAGTTTSYSGTSSSGADTRSTRSGYGGSRGSGSRGSGGSSFDDGYGGGHGGHRSYMSGGSSYSDVGSYTSRDGDGGSQTSGTISRSQYSSETSSGSSMISGSSTASGSLLKLEHQDPGAVSAITDPSGLSSKHTSEGSDWNSCAASTAGSQSFSQAQDRMITSMMHHQHQNQHQQQRSSSHNWSRDSSTMASSAQQQRDQKVQGAKSPVMMADDRSLQRVAPLPLHEEKVGAAAAGAAATAASVAVAAAHRPPSPRPPSTPPNASTAAPAIVTAKSTSQNQPPPPQARQSPLLRTDTPARPQPQPVPGPMVPPAAAKAAAAARARAEAGRDRNRADQAEAMAAAARVREEAVVEAARLHNQRKNSTSGGAAAAAASAAAPVVPPPMTDAEVRAWHERKRAALNQMATMQTIHAGSGLQSQVSDITLPTVLIPPGGDSSECGDFESLVSSTHARSSDGGGGGGGGELGPSHPPPPPMGVVGGVAVPVGAAHHHVAPSQIMPAVVEEDERRKSMLSRRTSLSGSKGSGGSDYNSVVEKAAAAVAAVQSSGGPPPTQQQQQLLPHRHANDDDVDVDDGRPKEEDHSGEHNDNKNDPQEIIPDHHRQIMSSNMPPPCTPATSNSSVSSSSASSSASSVGEGEGGGGDGDGEEDESLSTTEVDTPIETLSTHSKKSKKSQQPTPPQPQQQHPPPYQEHQQQRWQRQEEAEMEPWKNKTQPQKDKHDPLLPMDAVIVAKSEGGSTASPLSSRDSGGGRPHLDILSNTNMVVGSARSVESPRAHLTRMAMLEQQEKNNDVVRASEADAAAATPFEASTSTTPRLAPSTNRGGRTWDPTRQRQESEQSMLTNEVSENTSVHRNFTPHHHPAALKKSEAAGAGVAVVDADAGAGIGISPDVVASTATSPSEKKGWSKDDADHVSSGAAVVGGVSSVAYTTGANTENGAEERSGEKMARQQQPRLSQRSNQSKAGESSAEGSSDDSASDHQDEQPMHETQPEQPDATVPAAVARGDKRPRLGGESEGAESSHLSEPDASSSGDGGEGNEGSRRKENMREKKERSAIMRAAAMIHGEFDRSSVSTAQTEEMLRRNNRGDDYDDDGSSSSGSDDEGDYDHVEEQQDEEDDREIGLGPAHGVASLSDGDEERERPLPQPLHAKDKGVVSTSAGMTNPEGVRGGSVDEEHSDYGSDDVTNSQPPAGASVALLGAAEGPHGHSDGIVDDSSRSTGSGGFSRCADVARISSQDGGENGVVGERQESMWSVADGVDDDGRDIEQQQSSKSFYSDDEDDPFMSKHKPQDQFFEEYDYNDEGRKSQQDETREVPSGAEDEDSFLGANDAKRKDVGKASRSSLTPITWMKDNKWYIFLFMLIVAGIVVTVAVAVPMSNSDSSDDVALSGEQSAPSTPTTAGGDNVSTQADGESGGDLFASPDEPTYQYKEPMLDESFTSSTAFKAKSWQMIGADIFAASDFDRNRHGVHVPSQTGFSISMSKSGHRVAVGSRHDSSRGMDKAGSVSIYEFTPMLESGFWRSIGIIHGHFPGDQLGFSVSLSEAGDILAVGALGNDGNGDRSGQVRVFRYDPSGMQWIPFGQPLYGTNPLDLFGMSVSLSGSGRRLAVGSPYHDGDGADSSGCAVVFEYDERADQWGEMLGSRQKGTGSQQYFGWSVSLSSDGNHLAVGAPNRGGLGYVRLYRISLSEGPIWESAHTIESEDASDDFGYSISLSETGEVLAVGAPNGRMNGAASGYVAVYSNDVTSTGLRGDYIVGGNAGDSSGYAVDLSSDGLRLIIGSPSHDSNNGANSGRGVVHQFNGWTWDSGIPVYGSEAHSEAGLDVAISASGTRFAMGLPHRYCTGKCGNGYVRVYE